VKALRDNPMKDVWLKESDLYACIATIDSISRSFERGEIDPVMYKKQLRALIKSIFKSRIKLEQLGDWSLEEFIKREKLGEKYPLGVVRLGFMEGIDFATTEEFAPSLPEEERRKFSYKDLSKKLALTADLVASMIELIDILRLKTVARIDMIVPLMEETALILDGFSGVFGEDYWIKKEMNDWKKKMEKEKPDKLLSDDDIKRLEFAAVRWLNDFRQRLRTLG